MWMCLAAAAPLQFPAAAVEPHPSVRPSASSSTERSSRPQVAKPPRSSVDKEMKQSPDRASKSPPAPPPRRSVQDSLRLTFKLGLLPDLLKSKTSNALLLLLLLSSQVPSCQFRSDHGRVRRGDVHHQKRGGWSPGMCAY